MRVCSGRWICCRWKNSHTGVIQESYDEKKDGGRNKTENGIEKVVSLMAINQICTSSNTTILILMHNKSRQYYEAIGLNS